MRAQAEFTQLVVVDNASHDGTAEAVRARFPEVTLVPLGTNIGAAGRNAGVARLETTYVAFCDDDAWWSPALWTAWMRRRAADAWRRSGSVLGRTRSRREQAVAIAAALGGPPWVVRRRRVVPGYIEEALRRLDGYADRRRRRRGVVDSGIVSGVASGSSSRLAR